MTAAFKACHWRGGAGLGWASPGLYTVPASVQEGNQRLGHQWTNAVLWYCLWHFFFFFGGCQNGWRDEARIPATEMWHWVGILISTWLLWVLQWGGHGCIKALYPQSVVSCMMTPSDPTTKITSAVYWLNRGGGNWGVGGSVSSFAFPGTLGWRYCRWQEDKRAPVRLSVMASFIIHLVVCTQSRRLYIIQYSPAPHHPSPYHKFRTD